MAVTECILAKAGRGIRALAKAARPHCPDSGRLSVGQKLRVGDSDRRYQCGVGLTIGSG